MAQKEGDLFLVTSLVDGGTEAGNMESVEQTTGREANRPVGFLLHPAPAGQGSMILRAGRPECQPLPACGRQKQVDLWASKTSLQASQGTGKIPAQNKKENKNQTKPNPQREMSYEGNLPKFSPMSTGCSVSLRYKVGTGLRMQRQDFASKDAGC